MVLVIAHRGASAAKRENTLDAFVEARRMGADMVELDVRRTADGGLAIHHDAHLPDGRALMEVATHDLPAWLPLLDAALEACDGMAVNVEVKNWPADVDFDPDDTVVAHVGQLLVEMGWVDRVVVSCFNLRTVDRLRTLEPGIPTAWLVGGQLDLAECAATAARHGHAAIHPHDRLVTAEGVVAAHDAGLRVNVWTVDDPDRMRELASWGVDGIVTNVPDVAVSVVNRSGR